MATVDISGIYFFMPVFSFLFVTLILYAIILGTKILGENKLFNLLVSFIIAVIFMSFSGAELYIKTIIPWFGVLFVMVFLVLLLSALAMGKAGWVMKPWFGWIVITFMIIVFLISAIKVFNPVFHPDLGIISGEGTSIFSQIREYQGSGKIFGSFIFVIVAILVAWFIIKG